MDDIYENPKMDAMKRSAACAGRILFRFKVLEHEFPHRVVSVFDLRRIAAVKALFPLADWSQNIGHAVRLELFGHFQRPIKGNVRILGTVNHQGWWILARDILDGFVGRDVFSD